MSTKPTLKYTLFGLAGLLVLANFWFAVDDWREATRPSVATKIAAPADSRSDNHLDSRRFDNPVASNALSLDNFLEFGWAIEPGAGEDEATVVNPTDSVEMAQGEPEYYGDGDVPAERPGLGLPPIKISKMERFEQLNDVVELLRARRRYLIEREDEIVLQRQLLDQREAAVSDALMKLTNLRAEIDELIEKKSADEEKELRRLVSVYESMKAKKAAEIFNNLGSDVLIDVARRMREAKFASILQSMNPRRAKQITEELAERAKLPDAVQPTED